MMRTIACLFSCLLAMLASGCTRTTANQTFDSPEEAAQALVAAARASGTGALLLVLGQDAEPLVDSGDPVQDGNALQKFVAEFEAAHAFEEGGDHTVLVVGADRWPFPFPLVHSGGGWHFDSTAGANEIVSRRIGANELATIQSCLAFVDAQREYYLRNPEQAPLLHYAQRLLSSADKRDGLYWPTVGEEPPSPLGEAFAVARSEGYLAGERSGEAAYHGYLFKLLTSQGSHAPGGAYDYMTHGELLGGFALLAFPAEYANSGIMTFMVSHEGIVYSRDLGPDTAALADKITTFDPDADWNKETGAD